MSRFDINIPDDFFGNLFSVNVDDVFKETLEKAAPQLEAKMKSEVQSNIKHESTGELVESISAFKPTKARNGAWIVFVGPKGYSKKYYYKGNRKRKYPLSNAGKLIMSELGTSHQPARPVIQKAVNACKAKVYEIMQQVYDEKVGGE